MTRLHLSPLPSARSDEVSGVPFVEEEGFVDDSVVMALVAGPITQRATPKSAELALAADDMDFAGWCLSSPSPATAPAATAPAATAPAATVPATPAPANAPSAAIAPRPAPPLQEEPGIGEPHQGHHHRWWLAGLAGAMSTLLISALLLSLSSRGAVHPGHHNLIVETLTKPQSAVPAESVPPKAPAPQLTDVSP